MLKINSLRKSFDSYINIYCLFISAIHTAAIEMLAGKESGNHSRKPEIMADAAYAVLTKDSKSVTGKYLIDEDVLKEAGVNDLTNYAVNPGKNNILC